MDNPADKMMQILGPYLDDLWLERRYNLDGLIEMVASANIGDSGQFLTFLKLECSGLQFNSDRQWSDLLNLMQISKLINHKTLRLSHLLKNKQQIELNGPKIRQFNEKARRLAAINNLMVNLEDAVQTCQLDLNCVILNGKISNQIDKAIELNLTGLIDQIITSQRYVQDFCRVPLNALQAELRIAQQTKSNGLFDEDNFEQYRQKMARFRSIVELFEDFLQNFMQFEDIIRQLNPLMANSEDKSTESGQATAKSISGNSINKSLTDCKTSYNQVLQFNELILNTLLSCAKQSREKLSRIQANKEIASSKSKCKANSIFLHKLIANNNATNKQTMQINLIKPECFSLGLKDNLQKALKCKLELDKIFNLLRLEFGRLYFVNDVELLRIISLDTQLVSAQTKETRQLLSKLYNNSIASFIQMPEDDSKIIGVENPFGERILFYDSKEDPILLHKRVNIYSLEIIRILNACMQKLRKTLRKLLLDNNREEAQNFDDIATLESIDFNLPVQLLILSENLKFCKLIESSNLAASELARIEQFFEIRLSKLNGKVEDNIDDDNLELTNYKHSACVSQTIQFLSILSELKMASKQTIQWTWQRKLRYNIDLNNETCYCLILDMKFEYNFDYLPFQVQLTSNDSNPVRKTAKKITFKRLIATKMTDRCLLVAAHALNYLRLGANPFGPAGSGKTETIKSLGHALGHLVIVHNCDESNDGKALDRLIWGLAHTGLWGCFDEFNRLSESTLSSVSSTLELVQTSLRQNLKTVQTEDSNKSIMSLDSNAAFFITLNPIDKANRYGGRRSLPANLRSLFQPISMIQIPMLTIVSESLRIVIASSRQNDTNCAISSDAFWQVSQKLVRLFEEMAKLTRDFLEANCEWDLRLVVAILSRYQKISMQIEGQKNESIFSMQTQLAMAIFCEVMPRLKGEKLLSMLKSNLVDLFDIKDDQLSLVSQMSHRDINLSQSMKEDQLQLCRNLYSQLETRNGIILLGPSKSGKTQTWTQLMDAINAKQNDPKIGCLQLNPRCCKRDELFGSQANVNDSNVIGSGSGSSSNENSKWIDGLFTHITRLALSKLRSIDEMTQFWIILDGPLEPDWVETLNSVLDDNQVLTLGSGERIDFVLPHANKSIKLIFETDDISFASPATISRLGLVYHNQEILCSQTHVQMIDSANNFKNILLENLTNLDRILVFIGPEKEVFKSIINTQNCTKYTCHANSIAQDLISLMDNTSLTSKLILLSNFDAIKAEDKWQVKSLEELLRFVVTYGKFYNPSKQGSRWELQTNEYKFIIQCETDATSFSNRLTSLCDIFKSQAIINDDDHSGDKSLLQPNQLIDAIKSHGYNNTITNILCNGHSHHKLINDYIIPSFKIDNVKLFNNSREIRLNLEELMKKLSSSAAATTTTTTAKLDQDSTTQLYVLPEIQFKLMPLEQRNQLLFGLNSLQIMGNSANIQFVYLSNHADSFWNSIGTITTLIGFKDDLLDCSDLKIIRDKMTAKLSNQKSHLNEEKLNWLAKKFAICNKIASLSNNESICEEFNRILANLLDKFETNSMEQKVSLERGLARLGKFEQNIGNVRDFCKLRVSELTTKRIEMDSIVKSLDEKVTSSELLKSQLRNMTSQQELKSLEITERQAKIEKQLTNVKPLLENSKRDIEQHLKPEALNEIRTLRSPPKTIKDILDGVFLLLGKSRDLPWSEAKSLLAKASLRTEITSLNLQKLMTQQMVAKLTQLMQDPAKKESYERSKAERASKAILPLLNWLLAVYEFGKVQANMLPLSKELKQLESEQAIISESMQKSQIDIDALEKTIVIDRENLQQLRANYKTMELESNKLNEKIDHALNALKDCSSQLEQWRRNLASIKQMELRNDPMRFAFYGTILATSSSQIIQQKELIDALELDQITESIYKLNNFVTNQTTITVESKNIDAIKLVELLRMRMLIEHSYLIPFIDLNSSTNHDSNDDAIQEDDFEKVQAIEQLICQYYSHRDKSEFQLISCRELSDWSNLLEIAMRLGKFIILHLVEPELGSTNCIPLDILDTIQSQREKIASSKLEIILVGNSRFHEALVSLGPVHCIKLAHSDTNDQFFVVDLKEKLMSKLMARFDTQLSDNVEKLNQELKIKRQERIKLESNLIMKLSNQVEVNSSASGNKITLDEPLIAMLSELQQKSKQFDLDLHELEQKLSQLNEKKHSIYEKIATEIAHFYMEKILPICKLNRSFYKMSLDFYMKLLFKNNLSMKDPPNYLNVIEALKRSLAPKDKLKASDLWKDVGQITSDLDNIIDQQLVECGHNPLLMIAVHDANKPSPQAYLDYLLTNKQMHEQNDSKRVYYYKLFATSNIEDNQRQIGDRLGEISSKLAESQKLHKDSKNKNVDTNITAVICILNAHLALKWINSKLLNELGKQRVDQCKLRIVCILVAEFDSNKQNSTSFEFRLLDYANCSYWHDEMSLSLVQRFELYKKTLQIEATSEMIAHKLILFHVICQERTKLLQELQSTSWSSYSFEYEQLARAWQTYQKQRENLQCNHDAEYFSNYIVEILYGSRMNTAEDELSLAQVAKRHFLDPDSSLQLKLFDNYRQNNNNAKLYNQLIGLDN